MPELKNWEQLTNDWQQLQADVSQAAVGAHSVPAALFGRLGRPTVLFAELEDVHSLWSELRLSPEIAEHADRFITSQWTVKDLLAHMASWWKETRHEIETVARGAQFDYAIPFALSVLGPTEWNQVEVEKRRSLDLQAVFAESAAEIERIQEAVIELPTNILVQPATFPLAPSGDPTALWKGNIAYSIVGQCAHQRMHLGRMEQWKSAVARSQVMIDKKELS